MDNKSVDRDTKSWFIEGNSFHDDQNDDDVVSWLSPNENIQRVKDDTCFVLICDRVQTISKGDLYINLWFGWNEEINGLLTENRDTNCDYLLLIVVNHHYKNKRL